MKKLLIIILSIFLFVGCSKDSYKDEIVAKVNGAEINSSDFIKTLKLYKIDLEDEYGSFIMDTQTKDNKTYKEYLKENVINQMIDMQIIYQEAQNKNLLPTGKEVNDAFDKIKQSIDQNEDYKKKLEENDIDDSFIKKQQQMNIALDMYKDDFEKNLQISDEEINNFLKENDEKTKDNEVLSEELRENIKKEIADKKYNEFIQNQREISEIEVNQQLIEKIDY